MTLDLLASVLLFHSFPTGLEMKATAITLNAFGIYLSIFFLLIGYFFLWHTWIHMIWPWRSIRLDWVGYILLFYDHLWDILLNNVYTFVLDIIDLLLILSMICYPYNYVIQTRIFCWKLWNGDKLTHPIYNSMMFCDFFSEALNEGPSCRYLQVSYDISVSVDISVPCAVLLRSLSHSAYKFLNLSCFKTFDAV